MMRLLRIFIILILGVLPTLAVQGQELSVTYRFLNLTTGENLDLYRNGTLALANNAREVFSSERVIETGEQNFQVMKANTSEVVAEVSLDLEANANFLLLAVEREGGITLERYDYDLSPIPTNRTRFELAHFTSGLPAFSLVGQNGDVLLENASPSEINRRNIPSGTYQLSFRDAGTGEEVLARPSFDAAQGFLVTVFLYGNDSANYFEVRQQLETLAYIRFANASLTAEAVDVYLDGELALENLPYLDSSDYVAIPSGDYDIAIFEAGAVPAESFALWEGLTSISKTAPLTIVIFGDNLMRVSPNLDDHLQIPVDRARLRFVNVAVNLPRLTVTTAAGESVLDSLEYALGSRNLLVDTGVQSLTFSETQGAIYNDLPNLQLEPNHIYTIIATGKPVESGAIDIMVLDWSWKDELDALSSN